MTLRLPADIHREAVVRARQQHLSLNEYLVRALSQHTGVADTAIGARHGIVVYTDDGERIGVV